MPKRPVFGDSTGGGSSLGAGRPRLHALADETDKRILECAVAAHGRYLVTGDRALRRLRKYRRIRRALFGDLECSKPLLHPTIRGLRRRLTGPVVLV